MTRSAGIQAAPFKRLASRRVYGRPLPVFLIALEKAVSTLALIGGAILAFVLRGHPGRHPVEVLFSSAWNADLHNGVVHWLATHIPYLSPKVELMLGIGLALWALLFAAQTIGVWYGAPWGELLVIAETAAFLPWEAWNIVRHHRPLEFVTTPVNIAVLAYLVHNYRKRQRRGQ